MIRLSVPTGFTFLSAKRDLPYRYSNEFPFESMGIHEPVLSEAADKWVQTPDLRFEYEDTLWNVAFFARIDGRPVLALIGEYDYGYEPYRICFPTPEETQVLRKAFEDAYAERDIILVQQQEACTLATQTAWRHAELDEKSVAEARLRVLQAAGLDDESIAAQRWSKRVVTTAPRFVSL